MPAGDGNRWSEADSTEASGRIGHTPFVPMALACGGMEKVRAWVPAPLRAWWHDERKRDRRRLASTPSVGRSGEPTFGALVSARKRWLFETLPVASAELHYDLFTKESQRRMAERLGLSTAQTYLAGAPLDEALAFVERRRLERFVIKPNLSSSSIGVRPLVREGDWFRKINGGRIRGIEGVKRDLVRARPRRGRTEEWIVEELLLPPDGAEAPLDDYKFYCFGGRMEFVAHMWKASRRPHKRWANYTRDWEPVEVITGKPNVPPAAISPRRRELVETAEAASAQLCYPFIRIDLYDTSRGVVLGEFTPGPGRRYDVLPDWDERLSLRWREAAAELEEGIRSGRIHPLMPDELQTDLT